MGFAAKFLQIFIFCIIFTLDKKSSNQFVFSKKQLFIVLWKEWHLTCIFTSISRAMLIGSSVHTPS